MAFIWDKTKFFPKVISLDTCFFNFFYFKEIGQNWFTAIKQQNVKVDMEMKSHNAVKLIQSLQRGFVLQRIVKVMMIVQELETSVYMDCWNVMLEIVILLLINASIHHLLLQYQVQQHVFLLVIIIL